jgi:hypothetical protein
LSVVKKADFHGGNAEPDCELHLFYEAVEHDGFGRVHSQLLVFRPMDASLRQPEESPSRGPLANAGIRAYAQMLSALKQGRVVFVMLDQGVKRAEDGQMQRFLGKDMAMPAGPAQPAATPKWKFSIEPPVPLGQGSLESDVQTLVALTERQILQTPHLWSWHHRRWCKWPLAPDLVA